MPKSNLFTVQPIFSIVVLLCIIILSHAESKDRKVYIVYMGSLPKGRHSPVGEHSKMMQQVMDESLANSHLIRSYERSFNGFAAKLTQQEANKLASMDGVVSVFPSKTYQLQTTRSWDFMGFTQNVKRNPPAESDIIVGLIDTGVWPESMSFNDEGFGPPPKKWKGTCNGGANFTCNNKLIGARHYVSTSDQTARDFIGHGTHTASIAAGNAVDGASFFGLAEGTARGAVPSARIAVYKVCDEGGCQDADILAGFDDAIADGVDIISLSIGHLPTDLNNDSLAIGPFHAMERGILTCHSAGNDGPRSGSVGSVAPWVLTAAASSIDRKFISNVVLGNGQKLTGIGINSFPSIEQDIPLLYGLELANKSCNEANARLCAEGCLLEEKVKGNIVLCDEYEGQTEASRKGALGAIIDNGEASTDDSFILPMRASTQKHYDYESISSYHSTTKHPRGRILKSETVKDHVAPQVASFSSRGPNTIFPDILKPDITAPGIDIFAAYSPSASLSGEDIDTRRANYTILSGTSMSCPHATSVAAYVKSFHPNWSASAIKSAIMTTAWPMNDNARSHREWGYGAGHINPVEALDPGLVYETSEDDYLNFLCGVGYSVTLISGRNITCEKNPTKIAGRDLNYPSISAAVTPNKTITINVTRTVTNVGHDNSTYKANISMGSKLKIAVHPEVLSFKSLNQKRSFVVTIQALALTEIVSASIVWTDGTHNVRSPIVVYAQYPSD